MTNLSLRDSDKKEFTSGSDIKALIRANGIYDRYEMQWQKKFARFGILDPYNTLTKTKEYIFITKPNLCILNKKGDIDTPLSSNSFFIDAAKRYKNSAAQLQDCYTNGDGPFMTMLSNSVLSSLDIPGIDADMIDTAGNVNGTRISYRGTSLKSDQDHSFSLEFEDTKYLDIYMIFKMWDEYEKLKWKGAIDFTEAESPRWTNYIINKVLHDQVSIYKFVVGDDGYRIVYWARLTGCIPTSVPRDAFSDMENCVQQKLTVQWKCHFVRDMDPIILYHFNNLVSPYIKGRQDLPLYDKDRHSMNSDWAYMPYIEIKEVADNTRQETNRIEYFLKWKK